MKSGRKFQASYISRQPLQVEMHHNPKVRRLDRTPVQKPHNKRAKIRMTDRSLMLK